MKKLLIIFIVSLSLFLISCDNNGLVLSEIPPNCTAVGIPAKIVKQDGVRVKDRLDQIHVADPVELELSGLRARLDMLEEEIDDQQNACPRLQKRSQQNTALWNNEDFWVI